jgi:hypothetical protein
MYNTSKLYGEAFYQNAQKLASEAFANSSVQNSRRNVGRLAFGSAWAMWYTENGGTVSLQESGLRIGSVPVGRQQPTILRIFESPEETEGEGTIVTTYKMNLQLVGDIDVYTSFIGGQNQLRQMVRAVSHERQERSLGITYPTDEQKVLLLEQLERGASGDHAYMLL